MLAPLTDEVKQKKAQTHFPQVLFRSRPQQKEANQKIKSDN